MSSLYNNRVFYAELILGKDEISGLCLKTYERG
jgi:hypothetical protein